MRLYWRAIRDQETGAAVGSWTSFRTRAGAPIHAAAVRLGTTGGYNLLLRTARGKAVGRPRRFRSLRAAEVWVERRAAA